MQPGSRTSPPGPAHRRVGVSAGRAGDLREGRQAAQTSFLLSPVALELFFPIERPENREDAPHVPTTPPARSRGHGNVSAAPELQGQQADGASARLAATLAQRWLPCCPALPSTGVNPRKKSRVRPRSLSLSHVLRKPLHRALSKSPLGAASTNPVTSCLAPSGVGLGNQHACLPRAHSAPPAPIRPLGE